MFKNILYSIFFLYMACYCYATNQLPGDTSFEAGPEEWLNGKSVLRQDAPFGKYVLELSPINHSRIYYGLIKAGKSYTWSFSMRSPDRPVAVTAVANHVHYSTVASPKIIQVEKDWKRYSIQLEKQKIDRNVFFVFTLPENAKVELDGMMISENPDEDYSASANPQISIAPSSKPGNIFYADEETPELEIGVAAPSKTKGKLICSTFDFYGNKCAEYTKEATFDPEKPFRTKYSVLDSMKRGYYLVRAKLYNTDNSIIAEAIQAVGVVPKPLDFDSEKSFFGIHPDGGRIQNSALPRVGIKWIRTYFPWRIYERHQGEYRGISYPSAKESGMSVLASLKLIDVPPRWIPASATLENKIELLRKFLPELDRLSSSEIKVWEIENEPDLIYPQRLNISYLEAAEAYGKIVKVSSEVFKKANSIRPVAAMAGSGHTSDEFIKKSLTYSDGKFDIYTFHPYTGSRYIGPGRKAIPPDAYIRKLILEKSKLCPGKRFWADEVGWAYDYRCGLDSESVRIYSDYTARALILMRSMPVVEKVMWFKAQGCYESNYYQYGLWRAEFEPLPATVFFADIAQKLDIAKPYKPVFEHDIQGYSFIADDGRPFAAVWKYKGNVDELLVNVPVESVKLTDLFGNNIKLKDQAGKALIPLSSTPAWLEIKDATPEEFVKLLAVAKINISPVTMNVYFRDENGIAGSLKNNLPKDQHVKLTVISSSGKFAQEILVPASGNRAFSTKIPGNKLEYKLIAESSDGRSEYDDNGQYYLCRKSDGNWDTIMKSGNVVTLDQRKDIFPPDPGIKWESAEDLSCKFVCTHDENNLYLAIDVTDPIHYQKSENYRAWNGDSVQIAFDTINDAQEGDIEFNQNDVEFTAWLSPKGSRLAKTFSPDGEIGRIVPKGGIDISRKGNITSYRIALPWNELGELKGMSGQIFRMSFIVNQNNGLGRNYWIGLSQGIGEGKYPWLYPKFIIFPK